MADFKTHMLGAALISGIAATGMAMVSHSGAQAVMGYFALGVTGGILPDIDSDSSIPIRVAFNVLSVVAAFLLVFHLSAELSLLELVLVGLGTFLLVRYGVFSVFTRFTVHRGLYHSIPAAILSGLVAVLLAHEVFELDGVAAWTAGSFVTLGFLVHLILDELYSVNLMGMKVKRSFGTAFNLGSIGNPLGTAGLYLGVAALYWVCPPIHGFAAALTDPSVYRDLAGRLLPDGVWFQGLLAQL
jgi:hypothetical protein